MEDLLSREFLEHPLFVQAGGVAMLALACWLTYWVARRFVVRGIERLILTSKTSWDDALHEAEVFDRLALFAPAFIGYLGVNAIPELEEEAVKVVTHVATALMLLVVTRVVIAFLTAVNTIHALNPENASHPIKGYVQVAKILVSIIGTILIVAVLLDKSPIIFLSGLGAMTAVLLLVFRDTILSLVASVQLSGNDMVRVGDWIEMPEFGADGDVIDVALHTVKVQNWDKTITTIPTHRLITDPFKNWRFMSLSGGRRIKRSLSIDMGTVRFLDTEEIEHLGQFALLRDYVASKREELAEDHAREGRNPEYGADVRLLTNLGTFRAYIERYLKSHPKIHGSGMTLLVRQLAPSETGIPIEVYCFTTTTNWNAYEAIQADIFDHLLAVAPEFGLSIFQAPAGSDLVELLMPGD